MVTRFSHKKGYLKYFVCKCLVCGKEKTVYIGNIINGKSNSCGCVSKKEVAYNINKKYNKYYERDGIVYVYLDNNEATIMKCDKDDWINLKELYWRESHSYAVASKNRKLVSFHRLVMNVTDKSIQIDHINGERADNRKENLRLCSNQENSFNKYKNSNNTSGYKGVYFDHESNKWRGAIQYNGKSYKSPKRYKNPEDAAEWYKETSNKLFKDFSVYNSRE